MLNKRRDEKYHIQTTGIVQHYCDEHHNRYEPTDYQVLDEILKLGYIDKDSVVVDYGCGKGRVDFTFSKEVGCRCIGIEYNEEMYLCALENLKRSKNDLVHFECIDASLYVVEKEANVFYFFNPFSVAILKKVMSKIFESFYSNPRDCIFIFYYPNDEYIAFLMGLDELLCIDEIDTNDIFSSNNKQERVLIFELVNDIYEK